MGSPDDRGSAGKFEISSVRSPVPIRCGEPRVLLASWETWHRGREVNSRQIPCAIEEPAFADVEGVSKKNLDDLVSIDFPIVPTIRFKLLYVLLVLEHSRRKVLHFNVTEHPTAVWTAQQIVEAFPWVRTPKYLLRDRDAIYGGEFRNRIHAMGIEQVLSAPRSPGQNPFVE